MVSEIVRGGKTGTNTGKTNTGKGWRKGLHAGCMQTGGQVRHLRRNVWLWDLAIREAVRNPSGFGDSKLNEM